ncbi:MAG: DUF484 family protein [Alphaproteobacteria bacterium]|jgi:uncharacterized protein YigA (DUF484 family)|nr:DUF484 family protein [Alphaproteobacteria bacterium]MBF0354576.1 DUF484 family protein [Alphaproteobacteria bacterium]
MSDKPGEIDPISVLKFLEQNPDFLSNHPQALDMLAPPERFDGRRVVDMQNMMMRRLQERMERLRADAGEVVAITRANLSSQARTHAVVLALMESQDVNAFLRVIAEDLPMLLDLDAAVLAFEEDIFPEFHSPIIARIETGTVAELMLGKEALLRASLAVEEGLYGAAAPLVLSDGLGRLSVNGVPGLMCLGSRYEGMFEPGQGLDLFLFLARAIERMAERVLNNR